MRAKIVKIIGKILYGIECENGADCIPKVEVCRRADVVEMEGYLTWREKIFAERLQNDEFCEIMEKKFPKQ